jgi:tetratricopeptide (TPR) repeat protein
MQQYPTAKDYYDQSLQIYTSKSNKNHCQMATVMASSGRIKLLLDSENDALESFQICLKLYNDNEHEKDSIFGYANVRIGQIYFKRQKFGLALAYFSEALRFFDEFNPTEHYNLISQCLLNIDGDNPVARCHLGVGMCYLHQRFISSANKHFFKALSVFQGPPDQKFLAFRYYNLGTSYGYSYKYNDSLNYYTKLFSIDNSTNDKEKIVVVYNVYNAVGYYFRRRSYNEESLKYCEKAFNILEKLLPQYDIKRVGADLVLRIIRTKISGNHLQRWLIDILLLYINLCSLPIIFLRTIRRFMHF